MGRAGCVGWVLAAPRRKGRLRPQLALLLLGCPPPSACGGGVTAFGRGHSSSGRAAQKSGLPLPACQPLMTTPIENADNKDRKGSGAGSQHQSCGGHVFEKITCPKIDISMLILNHFAKLLACSTLVLSSSALINNTSFLLQRYRNIWY